MYTPLFQALPYSGKLQAVNPYGGGLDRLCIIYILVSKCIILLFYMYIIPQNCTKAHTTRQYTAFSHYKATYVHKLSHTTRLRTYTGSLTTRLRTYTSSHTTRLRTYTSSLTLQGYVRTQMCTHRLVCAYVCTHKTVYA